MEPSLPSNKSLTAKKQELLKLMLKKKGISLNNQAISRRNSSQNVPLSFAQQRLWFLNQWEGDSANYNIPAALQLTGKLQVAALEEALREIVRRHEILRTSFQVDNNTPIQVVDADINVNLSVVDLQTIPSTEQARKVQSLIASEISRPFDITVARLFRVQLLCLNETSHVLLLNLHHIVSDGWSVGVFIQEFSALYTAFSQGKLSPLPELEIQYADFALWQRQSLTEEVLANKLKYWQEKLADATPLLELPTDHPRPKIKSDHGRIFTQELSEELTQKVKTLSQQTDATLFMTLQAAFVVLLHRYSSQTDILVGTPVANRNRSEIEPLIGFFVNTLILRNQVSGNLSFLELLKQVQQTALDAFAHQDVPFEQVVEALQPERNLSYSPLFQVMFILQNAPQGELELSGLNIAYLEMETVTAKFDLTLSMEEIGGKLRGKWQYNSDLFEADTIVRMAGHFQNLLDAIVANPEQLISDVPLLNASERHQLLVEWNQTQVEYPHVCLHQLFEQQVEKTPDAIALTFEEQSLTYSQLNTRANQLAKYLQSLGVGTNTLVGICVERSLEIVVGLLGILKAGGAFLPLDSEYPRERLQFMIQDSQIKVLLTQKHLLDTLPPQQAKIICLDRNWQEMTDTQSENEAYCQQSVYPIFSPDNLAYVMYTSGSTGKPKGAMITHRAIVNHMMWMQGNFPLTQKDKVLQKTPISFDTAIWEVYAPLISGAQLVMAKPGGHRDINYLINIINQYQITALKLVPFLLQVLLDSGDFITCKSLKRVLCGGEVVTRELVECFQSQSNAGLYNLYGPTEATIDVTCSGNLSNSDQKREEQEEITRRVQKPPIGHPIANTQVYILDQYLQPVPVGVPGEIYVGGFALAQGYLNRPELTKERFIKLEIGDWGLGESQNSNPNFLTLYKTGDLARYLPDGTIDYIGRADFQVKLRGVRIELGEIESAINQHPQVKQAVAIVQREQPDTQRLVAYLIPEGKTPTNQQLLYHLKKQLPNYMIPSAFVVLETFPCTPSGKLDRKALPAQYTNRTEENFVPPSTQREILIADIFASLLKVQQVSINDSFFELGGHSLLATQVITRVREIFNVEVPLKLLFESPTVAQLDQAIQKLKPTEFDATSPPLVASERDSETNIPLSWSQQRLWFLDQLEGSNATYNIPSALKLEGDLNVAALEEALQEIIRRHEVLRTSFESVNGEPVQVIAPQVRLELPVINLQNLPQEQQSEQVKQRSINAAQTTFNLAIAPLMQLELLRLGQNSHILLINVHHIISDGWSSGIFIEELSALYAAFVEGKESPLAELEIQYADFALWQREWLSGKVLEEKLNYWRGQLADSTPLLELPTDHPRPAIQTDNGANHLCTLDADLTAKVKQLSQEHGVTLFMTLEAIFATLLYRYSGQTDITIGTPIANRNRSEIEALIGVFINTLVLRTNLEENPKFSQLLQQVRRVSLEAYANQDVPFEKVVEAVEVERNLSHSPLFQVMFVLQNTPSKEWELPRLSLTSLPVETVTAKFDLTLSMEETDQGLVGNWEYNRDLFESETIERLANHFENLVTAVVENTEERVGLLPLLSASEQQRILVDWNNTNAEYPTHLCLHQLFEAQVEKTPDAVAVELGSDSSEYLTYRELNNRANQLAGYLQSLGIKSEKLVGICVERSLNMVVALLATLKAGGAYVPLDPKYPVERLEFMVEDAEIEVLLTQQSLVDLLPNNQAKRVCLDSDWQEISSHDPQFKITEHSPKDLAYTIYTSGSTGKPKGVEISHGAVVNFLHSAAQKPGITSKDVMLAVATLSFDIAVLDIFLPLMAGGKVVLVSSDIAKDGFELQNLLMQSKATIMQGTPATWRILLDSGWKGSDQFKIICGGELLPRDFANQLLARSCELWNAYGPSETTIWSTIYKVEPGEGKILIGHPINNTQIYLLDTYGQPVPIGVAGELHIGGAGLAKGYRNRPQLTGDKFIHISGETTNKISTRLYKTGDLARYNCEGNLEYVGRIDHQVKLRGFRIELGEIEAVITSHYQVKQAVVIVREDRPGIRILVAYVLPHQETPDSSELRNLVQQRLPEYMIPNAFVFLDTLPLTPNRKVNRRALPKPDLAAHNNSDFVAPGNSIEQQLAQIWCDILGLGKVSTNSNFFDLGGDSILSIQIVARAHQEGIKLTPKQIFQHQTIAQLADVCTISSVQVEQGLVTGDVPLTPIQHWFFEQQSPQHNHFNQSVLLEVEPNLEPELLEKVFQKIIEHHDALRLQFDYSNEQWKQVNRDSYSCVPFDVIDLSALPHQKQEEDITAVAEKLQTSLNLSTGELLKVVLFQLGANQAIQLLIIIHHLAVDGVSWRILLEDISTAYQQLKSGESIQLPAKTNSFQDWAIKLLEYGQSAAVKSELEYWLTQSSNTSIPLDYPEGIAHNTVASKEQVSVHLSEAETSSLLTQVPQAYNTQINDILLAACLISLSNWTGENSLLIDLEGHGREELFSDLDISRTVGWFTAIFPVLLSLNSSENPGDIIKGVKEQLRNIPQRGVNYGIVRYLSDDKQISQQLRAQGSAQVCFNYLGQFENISSGIIQGFSDTSTGANQSLLSQRSYLLEVSALVAQGKLHLNLIYSKQVHQRSTIEYLAEDLLFQLQQLINHCLSATGGYTPSDFPEADLNQDELDALLAQIDG